ncbi:MAG: copper homeostasis protein CutC [Bacteroidales bacterium]|nr:copper homeostasis protein CutC [Bacteroidales bacterium]
MNKTQIEICCGSIQSAANAKAGGAVRIELCQGLVEGGTTPSHATIEYAVKELELQVFVLVRPRGGDFCYNELEIKTMEADVEFCKKAGVAGIVVGFLHPDGSIDTELTRRFVKLAAPLPVTFHRAFDRCPEPLKALEQIIDCGCARILTSGCKPTAIEGADLLKQLVQQANGRIKILAGSGVTPENAAALREKTGVSEIHGSCKITRADGVWETDAEAVKRLIERLEGE